MTTPGPILAFVGVLLVAFLTAYFARRRLDKQLRAEAERHDANLAAERERLTRQLRHDRHLDHIDAMRKVLIDAAEHLERFQFGMSHLERDPEQPAIGKFDPGGEFERALEEFQVIGTRLRLFFERAAMWSSRSRR